MNAIVSGEASIDVLQSSILEFVKTKVASLPLPYPTINPTLPK